MTNVTRFDSLPPLSFLDLNSYLFLCAWVFCLYVWMYTKYVLGASGGQIPRSWSYEWFEPRHGCWERSSGPLQEQQELSTASPLSGPSLAPLHCFPGVPVLWHPSSWILSVDPFLGVLYVSNHEHSSGCDCGAFWGLASGRMLSFPTNNRLT